MSKAQRTDQVIAPPTSFPKNERSFHAVQTSAPATAADYGGAATRPAELEPSKASRMLLGNAQHDMHELLMRLQQVSAIVRIVATDPGVDEEAGEALQGVLALLADAHRTGDGIAVLRIGASA